MFALTAGGKCPRWGGKFSGRGMSGRHMSEGKCPTFPVEIYIIYRLLSYRRFIHFILNLNCFEHASVSDYSFPPVNCRPNALAHVISDVFVHKSNME